MKIPAPRWYGGYCAYLKFHYQVPTLPMVPMQYMLSEVCNLSIEIRQGICEAMIVHSAIHYCTVYTVHTVCLRVRVSMCVGVFRTVGHDRGG